MLLFILLLPIVIADTSSTIFMNTTINIQNGINISITNSSVSVITSGLYQTLPLTAVGNYSFNQNIPYSLTTSVITISNLTVYNNTCLNNTNIYSNLSFTNYTNITNIYNYTYTNANLSCPACPACTCNAAAPPAVDLQAIANAVKCPSTADFVAAIPNTINTDDLLKKINSSAICPDNNSNDVYFYVIIGLLVVSLIVMFYLFYNKGDGSDRVIKRSNTRSPIMMPEEPREQVVQQAPMMPKKEQKPIDAYDPKEVDPREQYISKNVSHKEVEQKPVEQVRVYTQAPGYVTPPTPSAKPNRNPLLDVFEGRKK